MWLSLLPVPRRNHAEVFDGLQIRKNQQNAFPALGATRPSASDRGSSS
jgi:hypothetical protein